jgi:hypothetical protein
MYSITDQQIDFIQCDIRNLGIVTESLQQNLLDHICIIIEQNLNDNENFEEFYNSTIKRFYRQELKELEEETIFLLDSKGLFTLLSRNQFFLLLFTLFIGPFIAYDLFWYINSNQTNGFNIPFEVWGAAVVYPLFPLLVLLVLFLTPDRLDPLIPRKSKILLGIKPFIKIVPPEDSSLELA